MIQPPFSFKYDGYLSSQLLPKWDSEYTESVESWLDPDTGLMVEMWKTRYDTGVVEWYLTFTNMGDEPTPILQDVWTLNEHISGVSGWGESAWVHRLKNGSLNKEDDWLPIVTEMAPGSLLKFSPADGRSSSGACPFFNVEWEGGGVIVAIGWTGQWRTEIAWGTKTEIRVGMARTHLSLQPGESIRTPSVMLLYWEGAIEDSYNLFRKTMLEYVYPQYDGVPITAPIAHLSTAAYEWNWSSEKDVLSYIEPASELGFECLWLDAYYFKDGFPKGVGNLSDRRDLVDEERFPNGLSYIADRAHAAGMEWLVWISFEAINPGTWLEQEHSNWLLSAPGRKTKLFDLGNPDAREWITLKLVHFVEQHKLDWLRIDCCPATKFYWYEADEPDRVGMTEICWVEGLYAVLDHLRKVHPNLKIDNCDGGGRRIDLEMCKRSLPLWRTDYTTPVMEHGDWDRGAMLCQTMIAGLSRYVPFNSCGNFSEKPYYFRSCYNGGTGILEDIRTEFYDRDTMKAAIAEAKRIRKYFYGDLFLLTDVTLDPKDCYAYQHHRPEQEDGMVMLFKRHECYGPVFWYLELRRIDVEAEYEVDLYYDYELHSHFRVMGSVLATFPVGMHKTPDSALIEYRRVDDVSA